MAWLITKYLMTAALVVLVSEVAKRSDRLGALLVALPCDDPFPAMAPL